MKKNYIPSDTFRPTLIARASRLDRLADFLAMFAALVFCPACVVSALLLSATNTLAATITVTNGYDSGPGSFRQAILDASPGDTINFAAGVTVINLTSNALVINKNLTVTGPGPSQLVVQRSSAASFPILDIVPSSTAANISGLTILDGSIGGGQTDGGIYNEGATTVTNCVLSNNTTGILSYGFLGISSSTISNNELGIAGEGRTIITNCTIAHNHSHGTGGGIFNSISGTMTITSSTVSGNSSGVDGGGIYNAGSLDVTNSTISGNTASASGGGIRNGDIIYHSGTLNVSNSTISGNSATNSGGGIYNYAGL